MHDKAQGDRGTETVLSPYRVLDLTTERGMLCGQLLGDLGADVIVIEPPYGSPVRRHGPFDQDTPHPDRSLFWWAYNRNKRSMTLDITTPEGQTQLRRLVAGAHFLLESHPPGTLAAYGLGYTDLAVLNPALVYVSITPFGQEGPKASYADSDLTLLAAGGQLAFTGDADRPPVRPSVPQAYLHASAEAAGAALIAHHARQRTGRGQHVDVSVQQAVALTTMSRILVTSLDSPVSTRAAGGVKTGPFFTRQIWPTRDGYVSLGLTGGPGVGRFTQRLMAWIHDEGFCDVATRDKDWMQYVQLLLSGQEPLEEYARVQQVVTTFTKTKTKAELFQAARERGLLIAPMATIDEVLASEHLQARDYWQTLWHPEVHRCVCYPGPFARFSATPITYRRRPPTVGEHTQELEAELAAGRVTASHVSSQQPLEPVSTLPLADVKVLDFTWVMAGPVATRVLADYGATVIRVESTQRPDPMRLFGPYHDGEPGIERSGWFQNTNAGKLSMTLDLSHPAARTVVLDLVRWADVVTESFSPRAMRAWGLDYAALQPVKPDLIMLSSCLMGQSGPWSRLAGYGNLASAIAGFDHLVGWPNRPPAGMFIAYTDTVAPRFTVVALLAALEYRRRTGQGQYIDQSQLESALHFLSPALLDYTVNGRVQGRVGNGDAHMAPHGVYPTAGEDRWVAIAVATDAQWQALCTLMERPELCQDSRYTTANGRLAHQDVLDALLAAWTHDRDALAVEALLQTHGVAASVVQNMDELYHDPQLVQRGHFVRLSHPLLGATTVEGSRFRLVDTPAQVNRAAPMLGCDTRYILETILGYAPDRIAALEAQGVFQ